MLKKNGSTVFFLLVAALMQAQSIRLSNFNIDLVDNNKVLVRWVMNAGSTCRTLEVERSENRVDFNSVYAYPGICGGTDEEEAYTWVDDQAGLNRMLYYRVKLAEGEYSLLDSILITANRSNQLLTVSPNPSNGIFKIDLKLQKFERYSWELYTPTGLLMQLRKNKETPFFQIDLSAFNSGVYILKVRLQNNVATEAYLSLVK